MRSGSQQADNQPSMHSIALTLRQAVRGIRRNSLRSGLAALGVVIGVGAVIAMTMIGEGAKRRVEALFANTDARTFSISAHAPIHLYVNGAPPPLRRRQAITTEDYSEMRQMIGAVASMTPMVEGPSAIGRVSGRKVEVSLVGVDVEGMRLLSRRVVAGASFTARDVRMAAPICVVSHSVAAAAGFEPDGSIGRMLVVRGVPLQIVGVIEDRERVSRSRSGAGDSSILLPYSSLLSRFNRDATMHLVVQTVNLKDLPRLRRDVFDLMERRRGDRFVEFRTLTATQAVDTYSEGSRTMSLFLSIVAGISLIVGGIGIMNIMLASVTERTREVGVRMAIGSRHREISRLFLLEAITLSLFGGCLGVVLGIGTGQFMSYVTGWPVAINLFAIVMAFGASALVGAVFGSVPARRAATLAPAIALRTD
jgi:putative ABC transport system permease protein